MACFLDFLCPRLKLLARSLRPPGLGQAARFKCVLLVFGHLTLNFFFNLARQLPRLDGVHHTFKLVLVLERHLG